MWSIKSTRFGYLKFSVNGDTGSVAVSTILRGQMRGEGGVKAGSLHSPPLWLILAHQYEANKWWRSEITLPKVQITRLSRQGGKSSTMIGRELPGMWDVVGMWPHTLASMDQGKKAPKWLLNANMILRTKGSSQQKPSIHLLSKISTQIWLYWENDFHIHWGQSQFGACSRSQFGDDKLYPSSE